MSDLAGQTIRSYEIREKIGEGGSGAVYRAYQPTVDREVAVKVILPQYANEPEFARRFENEARLVARLEHPHIIPLHDYWQDDNGAFLVMRFLKGGSLRHMLKRHGAISVAQTVRLLEQVGEALTVAHQTGVIHRDLKPDNILLDERGNAYLSDFGIAKNLQWDDHISTTGRVVGTPAYLSPEQIKSLPVTPQTDIYSLGFVLYEMLTGEHPFSEASLMLVMHHLQDPVPSLCDKRADLSPDLDSVIQKAVAKEPVDRYADVSTMVADFRRAARLLPDTPVIIVEQPRPALPPRKIPSTPDGRNRYNMLQNVHAFWIQGVLENALSGAEVIDLGLRQNLQGNSWDTLMVRTGTADQTLPPGTRVLDVFDRMNGKLLILGDPGSGKTTLLLELARDLLRRADHDDQHPIPVVLNLSSWPVSQKPLVDWLVDELNSKYQAPKRTAKSWVDNDELLLLLDGLDEVDSRRRNACVEAINVYRQEHGFVDVVVCSRTEDYQVLATKVNLNGGVVLKPLADEQVQAFLAGLGPDLNVLRTMLDEDEKLREMSRSPLILNIMTLAYQGITSEDLPRLETAAARRKHLFDVYVKRMLERRGNTQLYSDQQTIHYLSWLARTLESSGQTIFLIEQMQPASLDESQRRRYFRQFSLTSTGVQALAWGIPDVLIRWIPGVAGWVFGALMLFAGGIWGWIFASRYWRRVFIALVAGGVIGLAYGIPLAMQFGMEVGLSEGMGHGIRHVLGFLVIAYLARQLGFDRATITLIDSIRFSVRAVKPPVAVIGIVTGSLLVLTGGISTDSPGFIPALVVAGIIGAGVVLFLSGLTSAEISRTLRPNQGIRNSLKNAIAMSVVFLMIPFLVTSLPVAFSDSLAEGVALAVTGSGGSAALGFLLFGGYTLIQHFILRRILHKDGVIPANYAHFLNYAASLIFLRKVGGGYIFVHRYLAEYFARIQDKSN